MVCIYLVLVDAETNALTIGYISTISHRVSVKFFYKSLPIRMGLVAYSMRYPVPSNVSINNTGQIELLCSCGRLGAKTKGSTSDGPSSHPLYLCFLTHTRCCCRAMPKRNPSMSPSPAKRRRISGEDEDDAQQGATPHERPRNHAVYGQKSAFPGLDVGGGDDELFYGPAEDGLEYLRMVRYVCSLRLIFFPLLSVPRQSPFQLCDPEFAGLILVPKPMHCHLSLSHARRQPTRLRTRRKIHRMTALRRAYTIHPCPHG